MKTLYIPKGKAKEYGDYAVNIYTGCPHRCYYCFAPTVLHRDREEFHTHVEPRPGIVDALKRQLEREDVTGKLIHLCFTCDPYPTGYDTSVTREVIKMIKASGNHVQILTKGDGSRDFDLLDGNDWYGITYDGMPHVIPLNGWSEEGADTLDNMLPACRSCNDYKSAMNLESFRKMVENMPTALARDSVTYRNAVRFGLVTPNPHPVTFYFEKMQKIIHIDDLPDCETCYDPTKRRDGVIFDCPGPGEITPTYTCENKSCQRKWNAVGSFILRREIADKEDKQ